MASMKSRKNDTRAYTDGIPTEQPAADPNDTTPIWRLPPSWTASGPPESPLHDERPPSPLRQTFWGWIRAVFQRAMQSALVMTGLLVNITTGEVAPVSVVRPNPETVPVIPPN
uniref:Uncharacterized protein n=1 Tax=Anopheles culicifacies TaxID=139723 RepID=A0A182MFC5_9DIPT